MTLGRGFYGWKLVFILWLLDFLNMGFPLYGGAVINTYMLKEIPIDETIGKWSGQGKKVGWETRIRT